MHTHAHVQGQGGRTHLMSPQMAAAAAIKGKLADCREFGDVQVMQTQAFLYENMHVSPKCIIFRASVIASTYVCFRWNTHTSMNLYTCIHVIYMFAYMCEYAHTKSCIDKYKHTFTHKTNTSTHSHTRQIQAHIHTYV